METPIMQHDGDEAHNSRPVHAGGPRAKSSVWKQLVRAVSLVLAGAVLASILAAPAGANPAQRNAGAASEVAFAKTARSGSMVAAGDWINDNVDRYRCRTVNLTSKRCNIILTRQMTNFAAMNAKQSKHTGKNINALACYKESQIRSLAARDVVAGISFIANTANPVGAAKLLTCIAASTVGAKNTRAVINRAAARNQCVKLEVYKTRGFSSLNVINAKTYNGKYCRTVG